MALLYHSVQIVFEALSFLNQTDKRHLKQQTLDRESMLILEHLKSKERSCFVLLLVHLSCHFSVVNRWLVSIIFAIGIYFPAVCAFSVVSFFFIIAGGV